MNVNRVRNFEDRLRQRQAAPVPVGPAAFLALPLPLGLAAGQEPSFVEALYRCAFERARAELQPRRNGPDLFAVWN